MTAIWRQTWRERGGGRGVAEQQWDERGEIEGGRIKKETISAGKMTWVTSSCDRMALNWPPFLQVLLPGETQWASLVFLLSRMFSVFCSPPFIWHQHEIVSGWITRWIAQSEPPYFLFRGGPGLPKGPVPRAVTWTSSWLSFTPSSLMRPDSRSWS